MSAMPQKSGSAASLPRGFRHLTIASGVRAAARNTPEKIAIRCDARSRTYGQLLSRIDAIAAMCQSLGLKAGEHAAIVAPNCLEYLEIVCGVAEIGAAVATPNPRLTTREIVSICEDAEARLVFVHPDYADAVRETSLARYAHVIVIDETLERALAGLPGFAPHAVPEWQAFSIPYTSGTTGDPKGVLISHRSRVLGFHGMAAQYGVYNADDTFLAIAPLCHGAGFAFAMASLYFGGTCEIVPKFDPEQVLRRLAAGEVSGVFMVPTHFQSIFALPDSILDSQRKHGLRAIMSNAAPLAQATKEQIVEYFGEGLLHELYGSTEAGIVTSLGPADQLRKLQCVGPPFANTEIKLLDEDGVEVGPNEPGELFSRSPYLFNGYWRLPEATDDVFFGSWVSVGDIAVRDDDGCFYIVDRKSDMVISGGINIYPREIEEELMRHDGVREAAVVGAPDEKWGERLVAFVCARADRTLHAEALQAHCAAALASYKVPREYRLIDALPRNPGGKVLKRKLRDNVASLGEVLAPAMPAARGSA